MDTTENIVKRASTTLSLGLVLIGRCLNETVFVVLKVNCDIHGVLPRDEF